MFCMTGCFHTTGTVTMETKVIVEVSTIISLLKPDPKLDLN